MRLHLLLICNCGHTKVRGIMDLKMSLIKILFIKSILVCKIYGIANFIDTNHPIVINGKSGAEESYFGYSIAAKPALGNVPSKVYIGAPNLTNSGALWECDLNLNAADAIRFKCVTNRFSRSPSNLESCLMTVQQSPEFSAQEYREEMFLGGTTISLSNSDVISCGHRWTTDGLKINTDPTERHLHGICFRKGGAGQSISTLLPTRGALCQRPTYCQYNLFGFSAAAAENQLLVGVPGYTDYYQNRTGHLVRIFYKGNAILMDLQNNNIRSDQCQRENSFASLVDFRTPPRDLGSGDSEYLGYSVAMGTSMAIGSPRGNMLKGYVSQALRNFQWGSPGPGHRLLQQSDEIIRGHQFGSYFGSVLAFANLFGDPFDALIVGSPMHSGHATGSHDEGCIYIYRKEQTVYKLLENLPICPNKDSGGRFGSSIANIGDINHDNFEDLAVGSPGADGGVGKVYIFLGGSLNFRNPQEISGLELNQKYKLNLIGFGGTLAGKDLDGNATPDLLIGSWQSEQVVVFRTRPKLDFLTKTNYKRANQNLDRFQRNDAEFDVELCITGLRTPADLDWLLNIRVEGSVDEGLPVERFVFVGDGIRNSTIMFIVPHQGSKDRPCVRKNVALLKELDANDAREITFLWKLSYDNVHEKQSDLVLLSVAGQAEHYKTGGQFCPRCPISTNQTFRSALQIAEDTCKDDGNPICTSDLKINAKITSAEEKESYSYIVGSNEHRILTIDVVNRKETAYNPTVKVAWSSNVNSEKIVKNVTLLDSEDANNCKESYEGTPTLMIECLKPLHSSRTIALRMKISFENLFATKQPRTVQFDVAAYPKIFPDQTNNAKPLKIDIQSDTKLDFRSLSEERIAISNLDVIHFITSSFEISNSGLSPIADTDVHVEFEIPQKYKDKTGEIHNAIFIYQPNLRFSNKIFPCNVLGGFSVSLQSDSKNTGVLNGTAESPITRNRRRRNVEVVVEGSDTQSQSQDQPQPTPQSQSQTVEKMSTAPQGVTLQFDCSREEWKCVKVTCNLGMNAKDNTTIALKLALNKTVAGAKFAGASRILLRTEGKAWIFDKQENAKTATSSSELILKLDNEIPAWIVFVSAIGGLTLFLMIAVCLFKCGFFRRKTKENLENLKAQTKQEELLANNFPVASGDEAVAGEG